jgi:hypothetical protein
VHTCTRVLALSSHTAPPSTHPLLLQLVAFLAVCVISQSALPAMGASVAVAVLANTVNGKTYCCGVGKGGDCGGPDWTPVTFSFDKTATSTDLSISIDGTVGPCKAELCAVNGSAITFPGLASTKDCLGQLLRGTGALTSDLAVTYDPTKDEVTVEVDSEGVTAILGMC